MIEQIDGAVAACRSAIEKSKTADELLESLRKQEESAKALYRVGEISKSELLSIQLELAAVSLARLEALVKAQQAIGELENAIQSPLDLKDGILESPRK